MSTSSSPPADHIFGDLDQPNHAVVWLNDRYKGVHHYYHRSPRHPKPGEPLQLFVTTSSDLPVEAVYLWMTTDDWQTQQKAQFSKDIVTWETALWSYLQKWTFSLPPQPAGTMLRYKIGAKLPGAESFVFADTQAEQFQQGSHYSLWYGGKSVPAWADEAIIYQIFVDRYNPGGGKKWNQQHDLRKQFGGTLSGITEKLPWIKSMGFNAVWLTPIFTSPSYHGYDISDYYQVNPKMGSLEDFRWLLDRAHQLDMKVILDFVANHCSSQHPFFVDAVRDPHSRYHDYFVWKQWPQYACFYNIQTMPKLNLAYGSPARDYLLECAQYWLSLGVDGFRLDYAHGPEQDFWVDFRQACAQINPEHWTFAEIVQPADVQASYAGGVGGTLDFLLCQAIRLTFGQQTWCLSQFCGFLQHHFDYFPKDFSLPAFIDNHDMNRFLVAANNDDRLLRLALLVLYVLPGAPIIYYGTEVPINQAQSIHAKNAQGFDEARLPMPWEAMEHSTLPDYLQKLAQFRHAYPDIYQTGWEVYLCDDQREMLVLKKKASYEFFLFINRSPREEQFSIRVEGRGQFLDLINGECYLSTNNHLTVMVEPRSARLLSSGGALSSG